MDFDPSSPCPYGKATTTSDGLGWRGVAVRAYHHSPSEVVLPEPHDYLLIAYDGATRVDRCVDGAWTSEFLNKGDLSIQTRAQSSRWRWASEIDVIHLYLSGDTLKRVSEELFDRDVDDVQLCEALKIDDPFLTESILALHDEARNGGLGSNHIVDAVSTQICIQILRRYSRVTFRDERADPGLSRRQARVISDYIEANLGQALLIDQIAAVIDLSATHFQRQFRQRFGCPPHSYIIQRRLSRAKKLLSKSDWPLKAISASCGFSDQSHMTRMFRRHLQITPRLLRSHLRNTIHGC